MTTKILPKLLPITPTEMYLQVVNSTYDSMRAANTGISYIPSQFGGIFGQEVILGQGVVMEVTSFEVR